MAGEAPSGGGSCGMLMRSGPIHGPAMPAPCVAAWWAISHDGFSPTINTGKETIFMRLSSCLAVAAYLLAAVSPGRAADPTVTIRLSHTLPATDPMGLGAERFKEL